MIIIIIVIKEAKGRYLVENTSIINNYCKKLSTLKRLLRTTSASRRSKTANIKKDDITLQHIAKMSLCSEVISSFLIFAVLDLREAEVVLKRRFKLLSFLQ